MKGIEFDDFMIKFLLPNFCTIFYFYSCLQQHNLIVAVIYAQDQAFTEKVGDLFWRKIDNSHHLPSQQGFNGIMMGDLGRRPLDAQCSKINLQLKSWFQRFFKWFNGCNRPTSDVNFFKIVPGDGHANLLDKISQNNFDAAGWYIINQSSKLEISNSNAFWRSTSPFDCSALAISLSQR
jgi:hypothetical protein